MKRGSFLFLLLKTKRDKHYSITVAIDLKKYLKTKRKG